MSTNKDIENIENVDTIETYEMRRIRKYKYSLKFVLISNISSFLIGLCIHYFKDHY